MPFAVSYGFINDLKDHFADRRTGLEHMLAPFERMETGKWQTQLMEEINRYAKTHHVVLEGSASSKDHPHH